MQARTERRNGVGSWDEWDGGAKARKSCYGGGREEGRAGLQFGHTHESALRRETSLSLPQVRTATAPPSLLSAPKYPHAPRRMPRHALRVPADFCELREHSDPPDGVGHGAATHGPDGNAAGAIEAASCRSANGSLLWPLAPAIHPRPRPLQPPNPFLRNSAPRTDPFLSIPHAAPCAGRPLLVFPVSIFIV